MKILVMHGPNLNWLGKREPTVYGQETLALIEDRLRALASHHQSEIMFFQSNHEGALIDRLQAAEDVSGLIINPGGLTHTSVVLRDALAALKKPTIEVHISNIYSREDFRHISLISGVCTSVISGFGTHGYDIALEHLLTRVLRPA